MYHATDEEFNSLVEAAVAAIPTRFAQHLNNVAFLVADEPTRRQLEAGGDYHPGVTLLGLYEGIPLPARTSGYNFVTPDIITVFKRPHEAMSHDLEAMRRAVHQTVWHEVAHYFGLNHGQIHALEER